MEPVSGWDLLGSKWTFCPQNWCMRNDLSEFHKGQIVMARSLVQSISKTAGICWQSDVVNNYYKGSKEGTVVNEPGLTDARRGWRLANRQATVDSNVLHPLFKQIKTSLWLKYLFQEELVMTAADRITAIKRNIHSSNGKQNRSRKSRWVK